MQSDFKVFMGRIVGYKRGSGRQYVNKVIVKIFTDIKTVNSLVGARVEVKDSKGNLYRGRIVKIHSAKNTIAIARFKPNIPGQLIGTVVKIVK